MPKGIYIRKPFSEEHKNKISLNHRCHQTEETRKKISLIKKGKKTGQIPWNKNSKGIMKAWNKGKEYLAIRGEKHFNWKGGVTSKNNIDRARFRKTIQKQIFERDNYTCQLCNQKGGYLQVDHIQSWKDYVELRFSINNCRTLCIDCHYYITWGKPKPENIKTWGHNFKERSLLFH